MKQLFIVLLFFVGYFANVFSQNKVWSLEDCLQYAYQHSSVLQQAAIGVERANLQHQAARANRLPVVNANVDGGFNFGRTIDPTTNNFISQQVGYNSFGVQSEAIIYNGGKISHTIRQNEYNTAVAKAEHARSQQQLTLDIITAYLDVLLAKEQRTLTQKQLEQTEEQLAYIDKQIAAGIIPANDRLEILAQLARNRQTLTNAQNNLEVNLLTLKNLMELPVDFPLAIAIPLGEDTQSGVLLAPEFAKLYQQAQAVQPVIKAAEWRTKSANLSLPIAKADGLPVISVAASVNSNYSNVSDFSDAPFTRQLKNNLGQSIRFRLAIPIFNRYRTRMSMQQAHLEIMEAELQERQVHQQLKAVLQNALVQLKGAEVSYQVAQSTWQAAESSLENAREEYRLGTINTLELATAKNNLDQAALDKIRAKYDYLFRQKIIAFYLGEELF